MIIMPMTAWRRHRNLLRFSVFVAGIRRGAMKPVEWTLCIGLVLLGAPCASAQTLETNMEDRLHDGWYFRGSTRANAEARIGGKNGTALLVDCKDSAPRILVYFRSIISAPGASLSETTTKRSIELTFQFQKRTIVSGLTSYFDKESVLAVPAEHISSGKPGEPPGRELVSILGGRVAGVLSQLKSSDSVSVGASSLGQPLNFELKGAAGAIDKALAVCSSGP